MKKFLILQMRPENEASYSEFEAILRLGGLQHSEVDRVRLEQGIPEIDIHDYAGIIAGGSPFDITTDPDKKSQQQIAIEDFYDDLFDQVVPADFPFFGACSGNGLLGKYCGAKISNIFREPIGSVEITVTEEGANDPLLTGLPKTFLALAGHKEACDTVPEGAVLLATSESCPVQMFRLKNNIYATQFHPEADSDEFILRIKTYKYHGYFQPEEAEELIELVKDVETPHSQEIFKRFVDRYAPSEAL